MTVSNTLKINKIKYENIIGSSWLPFYNYYIKSGEFEKFLMKISAIYSEKPKVYPDVANVFLAFRECNYDNLKVVIVGQDPYYDGKATGLAFANKHLSNMSPSLEAIFDQLGVYPKDPTLKNWTQQGVLLLNSALTVEANKPLSHIRLWTPFIRYTLYKLYTDNPNLVFLLWGSLAKSFLADVLKKDISAEERILTYEHPAAAVRNNRYWECPHFEEANKILESYNKEKILW